MKNYKELTNQQQQLYNTLGDILEKWAVDNKQNTANGIYSILEVLITLSLSMKALYLLHCPNKEAKIDEIRTSGGSTNPTVSNDADRKD